MSALEPLTELLDASASARKSALDACLSRIRDLDREIRAWVQVLPQRRPPAGSLGGIPIGVKDIIETEQLATEYGSALYRGRTGSIDAAIVRVLRQRGGIVLGKTHTTAFGYRTPAPTRNPRNLAHTPGGSSSGSAAAVAAGMVPVALGTQTAGSILRPASYCGVAGFKPTYGLLPMDGVLPLATSLDTLGFITRTAADALAFWEAIGQPPGRADDFPLAAVAPLPEVDPSMASAFGHAIARLREAGMVIRPVDIAGKLAALREAQEIIMFYEAARFHESRYHEHGAALLELATLVRDGLRIPVARYAEALGFVAAGRATMAELFAATPVVLSPAATGPAPLGLEYTGDAAMNAPWTALGTPAMTIPLPVGNELPLGLQLTANLGGDAMLLRTALRVEDLLRAGEIQNTRRAATS